MGKHFRDRILDINSISNCEIRPLVFGNYHYTDAGQKVFDHVRDDVRRRTWNMLRGVWDITWRRVRD